MDLQNAARFDEVVKTVFSALAEAFPKAIDLDFQALGLVDGPAYEHNRGREEDTAYTEKHAFAASCVRFLISEEYISGKAHPAWVEHAIFTAKGLERVGGLPASLRTVY
jgi:hypothetical protein